jgi:hypothetical protein
MLDDGDPCAVVLLGVPTLHCVAPPPGPCEMSVVSSYSLPPHLLCPLHALYAPVCSHLLPQLCAHLYELLML